MSIHRFTPVGMTPAGFQTISLTNSTAVSLNSTIKACTIIQFSVETNQVRYRCDGTLATKNTGVLLDTGVYQFDGLNGTSVFSFQRSTGTAKVSVMGYKIPGDPARS